MVNLFPKTSAGLTRGFLFCSRQVVSLHISHSDSTIQIIKKTKGRKKAMKKTICFVGIGLLLVSMVLAGCASMGPGPKTVITTSNVSMLQGKWSGWTTFSNYPDRPVMTTLLFTNATVPLQGSITLNFATVPPQVAAVFPADAKSQGGTLAIIDFKNGEISDQGTVIGTSGKNFMELTVHSGEKMKMSGFFYYYATRGRVEFTKQ
jgi:hypothetical protein